MFRVDAHHHLWDLEAREQPWLAAPGLAPLRRSFGIDELAAQAAGIGATVVVQTVPEPAETQELLALAAEHELIAGVVGWVDLTARDVGDALAGLDDERLVGIRHQVQDEPDPEWLCRSDVRTGLRAVADAGLVYDLLTLPGQLPAAIDTVRALDDLVFVLDHLSKPPIATGELEPWATRRARAGRPRERGLQALGHGHRGRLGGLERRRSAPVRRDGARGLRGAAGDVRIGLARLHGGRELRRRWWPPPRN